MSFQFNNRQTQTFEGERGREFCADVNVQFKSLSLAFPPLLPKPPCSFLSQSGQTLSAPERDFSSAQGDHERRSGDAWPVMGVGEGRTDPSVARTAGGSSWWR